MHKHILIEWLARATPVYRIAGVVLQYNNSSRTAAFTVCLHSCRRTDIAKCFRTRQVTTTGKMQIDFVATVVVDL